MATLHTILTIHLLSLRMEFLPLADFRAEFFSTWTVCFPPTSYLNGLGYSNPTYCHHLPRVFLGTLVGSFVGWFQDLPHHSVGYQKAETALVLGSHRRPLLAFLFSVVSKELTEPIEVQHCPYCRDWLHVLTCSWMFLHIDLWLSSPWELLLFKLILSFSCDHSTGSIIFQWKHRWYTDICGQNIHMHKRIINKF